MERVIDSTPVESGGRTEPTPKGSRQRQRRLPLIGGVRLGLRGKRYLFIYGCLLLPLLFFAAVRLLPILYSFNVSFREWAILSPDKPFVGFANFASLFQDEVFLGSLRNTAVYVIVGVPGQIVAGLAVALLLQRITVLRTFFRTVYFIPYITSVVAVSWVFRWILMKNGVANGILLELGLDPQPFLYSPSQSIFWIIAAMIWQSIGFQMLVFLAGLENIPRLYYDAASIDGAGSWSRFRHVTIPLLNPVILFSVVIASIGFLQSFTQVLNMTGGGPLNSTNSIVLYIYNTAFKSFEMGRASAATVILFVIILAFTVLQLKVLDRKVEY
ncbi:carbohydrate ABC transporter permease [Paenibacillus radicis (ex Gao et al. 2016)]|uniref:ABC transporter permease n=1 Tax=Paenibacillus radicis (ex Gao et al. 2016) TaxID=1737354 RepID=A0A917LWG4_9BACL|nr:sugar ABC transporter permease [Paenibacillus radicis (ex Gao et al. 2016)]GGG61681.1 ABC transporter permease [Paenibacillus radicis (ex Gao et al. 2016)]